MPARMLHWPGGHVPTEQIERQVCSGDAGHHSGASSVGVVGSDCVGGGAEAHMTWQAPLMHSPLQSWSLCAHSASLAQLAPGAASCARTVAAVPSTRKRYRYIIGWGWWDATRCQRITQPSDSKDSLNVRSSERIGSPNNDVSSDSMLSSRLLYAVLEMSWANYLQALGEALLPAEDIMINAAPSITNFSTGTCTKFSTADTVVSTPGTLYVIRART